MRTHTGVATVMFETLAREGINIQMITTSEIKISVLVDRASAAAALRVLHQSFDLQQPAGDLPEPFHPVRHAVPARGVVATTDNGGHSAEAPGMEDLVISGVELDTTQARVTLLNVPDQPGYAAKVFQRIGDAGVFVDMIVQNVSTVGTTHLSFTVPRADAERAAAAVRTIGEGDVAIEPALAKLSVMGVGMRSHTGVATRMFKALAERGINIGLINTSEVRINVATDLGQGPDGLECLKQAFPLPRDS